MKKGQPADCVQTHKNFSGITWENFSFESGQFFFILGESKKKNLLCKPGCRTITFWFVCCFLLGEELLELDEEEEEGLEEILRWVAGGV